MPNLGVHLLVSRRALQHWLTNPTSAPFDARDPRLATAFVYGSLLPDGGYFPRGDRLFSELAHVWRTGDLPRAMLDHAASPAQRAHAVGWLAHVLADLAVHPLINAAHGEWLYGDRARPVTSSEDEAGHMRLEFGLDSAVLARYSEVNAVQLVASSLPTELGHVCLAFRQVFGWTLSEKHLLAAQRTCRWMARLTLMASPVMSSNGNRLHAWLRALAGRFTPPLRRMPARWNESSAVQAMLAPIPPPTWLLDEIAALLLRLPGWLDRLLADDLAGLDNHDLVTGAVHESALPGPRAEAALRALRGRIGRPLPSAASP